MRSFLCVYLDSFISIYDTLKVLKFYNKTMNTIEDFADKLIQDKGLSGESPEIVAQIKSDLLERIENRVNAMILTSLDEQDHSAFDAVLDEGSEDAIQAFIKTKIPNIDEKVALELLTFKTLYLA